MTDITRLGADKLGRPKKSGPEQYAPPDRRAQVSDVDQAAVNAVEGEIRSSGATTSSGARLTRLMTQPPKN